MTSSPGHHISCTVEGEDKLPPGIGGQAICAAIESAAAPVLQKAGIAASAVTVLVRIRSQHTASAAASVDGKSLAEQHVASSDHPLAAGSIAMLADGVAKELARNL